METSLDNMELILTGVGLLILWVSTLVGQVIWVNVKLKELDMKSETNKENLTKHIKWTETQQINNDTKFKELIGENKEEHRDLSIKLDNLIDKFSDLRVYIETK